MPDNFFTGIMYGPQGPETRRFGDKKWGKSLEEAFVGKDDENLMEKTGIMLKYGFTAATSFAIYDIFMFHPKDGWPVALQRLKWHYTPWLGGVLAYQAAVRISCSVRGKTDTYNHVVGGFAAGAVIGKHGRSVIVGGLFGIVLACIGHVYKDSRLQNYEVLPSIEGNFTEVGNPWSHKLDLTTSWIEPRRGYWVRTPEEVPEAVKRGQLGDGQQRRLW